MVNINKILSDELKKDLLSLEEYVFSSDFENLGTLKNYLHTKYVLGCGDPICISDVGITGKLDDFEVYLGVDYKVTYGYKPYQDLDEIIILNFIVNKETKRDRKIKQIIKRDKKD